MNTPPLPPPPLFTPPLLPKYVLLIMTSYGVEYPFGQFGSGILFLFPPNILFTSNLLVWWGQSVCGGEAGLGTVQTLFSKKIKHWWIISAILFKSITSHTDCYEENSIPSRTSTTSTLYSKLFTSCSGHRLSSISSLTPLFLSPSPSSPSLSSFPSTVISPLIYVPSLNCISQPTVAYHRQV